MQWMKNLLISASCIVTIQCPVESALGASYAVRSADGVHLAHVVRRGEGAVSLSEIWLASEKDDGQRKLTAYPGEPGTLHFSPDGEALVYLERSLRREAWGSYFLRRPIAADYEQQNLEVGPGRRQRGSVAASRGFSTPRNRAFSWWTVIGDYRISGKRFRQIGPRPLGLG